MKQILLSIVLISCIFYGNQATDSCEKGLLPKAPCCGITNIKSARIVDGSEAEKNEFPWMVYIAFGANWCGGSLINSRWVLSAAHCFQGVAEPTVANFGAENCYEGVCAESAKAIKVIKIFAHKGFTGFANYGYNDIALLQLAESVSFSEAIKPICLPTKFDQRFEEQDAIVSGWGFTDKGNYSTDLLKTTVKIWSPEKCESYEKLHLISTYQICAGGHYNGSCYGDSGGPLFLQPNDRKENVPYYQVGIVSTGSKSCYQLGFPQIYTNVTSYIEWIETTISENQENYV